MIVSEEQVETPYVIHARSALICGQRSKVTMSAGHVYKPGREKSGRLEIFELLSSCMSSFYTSSPITFLLVFQANLYL